MLLNSDAYVMRMLFFRGDLLMHIAAMCLRFAALAAKKAVIPAIIRCENQQR